LIDSAVFAQYVSVTSTQTTLHVTPVAIGHISAMHAMQPKNQMKGSMISFVIVS